MPDTEPSRRRAARAAAVAALLLSAGAARAAAPDPAGTAPVLRELDGALAGLAARVSPAVVQVEVTGFGLSGDAGPGEAAVVVRQHVIGSGVIVDPDGWILTNQHVVRGAQRITVVLAARGEATARRRFPARVAGSDPATDLALLQVEARGLPCLPLGKPASLRQGELVFAVGSPQGLASTVTMGVVGSPERQVEFAQPLAFVQTDAPINPGNSGGPLVNVDGALVGITTFILSQSGGSHGLGFAIPVDIARAVYGSLRERGHVRRLEVGVSTQAITPPLAAGLGLPRDWGVVVADVHPGSVAQEAGVEVGDVVESIDGRSIDGLAAVTSAVYLHPAGRPVELVVLRGDRRVALRVPAHEAPQPADQLVDLADPEAGQVAKLGITGLDVTPALAGILPPLLLGSGVVVAARMLDATSVDTGLQPGDVIHAVNRQPVTTVEALRRAVTAVGPGQPVALQVERQGRLAFLAFEME